MADILTDGCGRPFERPGPPSPGAGVEDVIAYLRAHAAYNDAVALLAHRAFDKAVRKALRKK